MPPSWRNARFTAPRHIKLHVGELPEEDLRWLGDIPLSSPARTIADCLAEKLPAAWIEQALGQARRRKLITPAESKRLERTMRSGAA